MIVDDSATMRKIIMRTIRVADLGIGETYEAGNGAEALEKLKASAVDIMLCGINMPGMTGPELVRKVRELPACADTKIVIISTETAKDIVDDVLASGANGYITKPFTPEKFKGKLAPLMN
jgi:two-component system chemotaxis response regulator CheY